MDKNNPLDIFTESYTDYTGTHYPDVQEPGSDDWKVAEKPVPPSVTNPAPKPKHIENQEIFMAASVDMRRLKETGQLEEWLKSRFMQEYWPDLRDVLIAMNKLRVIE